jgi:asparagine synthase (glutamine-hydrolysing)
MCGFVGVVRDPARGPVRREELEALLPWLRHRGPDGEGVHADGQRGLAATRLAIQGGREGDQPWHGEGGTVVAFNGEILGPAAARMREELGRAGRDTPPQGAGDTPLLGSALVAGLDPGAALRGGMGAAAVLDRGAWVWRDALGIKPAFDLRLPGETWFSSEIKPLLAVAPSARRPSPRGLAELLRHHRPGPSLPFEDVRECAPGTRTCYGPEAPSGSPDARRVDARGDAPRSPRAALEAAARAAADVEGPVALLLSGGLDSSAVAALAGRADLLAVTGRFLPEGGAFDESAAAARVARSLRLRHEVVDLSDRDLLLDLPDVVRALEIPLAGPGSLALWRLARHLRGRTKVVLSGTGGDEAFGGYVRTALVLGRRGAWTHGYEALAERIERAGPGLADRWRAAMDRTEDLRPFLSADFLRSLPPAAPLAEAWTAGRAADEVVRGERVETLPALLHVEDRVFMAHGIEARPVPCLGEVPATAAALAADELVGPDGEGKRALRADLRGVVPEEVRTDRRKRGFPTPFARAARGAGRDVAESILADRRFAERGWWDVRACREALGSPRPDHDRGLFALLSWEVWARLFLDGDAFR